MKLSGNVESEREFCVYVIQTMSTYIYNIAHSMRIEGKCLGEMKENILLLFKRRFFDVLVRWHDLVQTSRQSAVLEAFFKSIGMYLTSSSSRKFIFMIV